MKKNNFIYSFLFLVLPLITNCGGGGGGGGSNAYNDEYARQEGLAVISADSLNTVATGNGVKVAVVDTGIDFNHQEFDTMTARGTDFASTGNAFYDGDGHGSHVAGIIAAEKDGLGMRGVAYDSTLYSYKIGNNSGVLVGIDTDDEWSDVIDQHDTDNIDVSNNSWGSSTSINSVSASWINTNYTNSVASLKTAITNGTVFVWATGNNYTTRPSWQSGMPYRISDIEDGWLAVMAVDHNKQETDYTNRCGVAADWCVAADGGGEVSRGESTGIYSVDANSSTGYVRLSGTSMAAPHVAGVLATVFEKFPSLTSAQVRNRILTTATYSGLTDTSGNSTDGMSTSTKEAIFGKGLVQPGAATSRIGTYVYPKTQNYYEGNNFNLGENKFNLPSGLSEDLKQKILNERFGVFDNFDGAFFSVRGYELFNNKTPNRKNFNKISYNTKNIIDKSNNSLSNLLFINKSQTKKPFDLLYYAEGPTLDLATEQQWGDKNSFLPRDDFFINNISKKMEVGLLYDQFNTDINAFILSDIKETSNVNGFGINFNSKISEKLKLLSSFSEIDKTANFSIVGEPIKSDISSQSVDFGFQYLAKDNFSGFYRKKISNLSNVEQSNFNFGLNDAVIESDVMGLEYFHNMKNRFTFGLYKPSHYTNGEISILSPSGREGDGTIYWENVDINIKENPNHKLFFASLFSIDKETSLELNLQQSDSKDNFVSGEIILNLSF